MRSTMLTSVLSELNDSSADIEASAITTIDGLVLASQLPFCVDSRLATLMSLGVQSAKSAARGALEQILIKSREGFIMLTHAGMDAVLAILAKPYAQLDHLSLKAKLAAESAELILLHHTHKN